MLASQTLIEDLASRIERAYILRRPQWGPGRSTARVWDASARTLIESHRASPALPLDPELFVAAQPLGAVFADPWDELTQSAAVQRYHKLIGRVVRALRSELRGEVRRVERRVARGYPLDSVLLAEGSWLSPLGRFLSARRFGRFDLAERFRAAAWRQHWSCPLYRQASLGLVAPGHYPVDPTVDFPRSPTLPSRPPLPVSRN